MIDSYLWGDVSRISPEAPIPIIATSGRENRLGGAANVALNIQSLGATPILCSVVGDDMHRLVFEELMEKRNLNTDGIIYTSQRTTTVKTRIISQNQHLLRVDEEMEIPVQENITKALTKRIELLLSEFNIDAIVFEDYDKGVITPTLIKSVVSMAHNKGVPTLVDPKKRNFMDYEGVTFFKPNFKEFKEGVKVDLSNGDKEGIVAAAEKFRKEKNISMLMITLAEKGVFVSENGKYSFFPAEIRDISDVSGAGDTVISVSALCLASELPADVVARIANMAGGLVCEVPGVVPVDKNLLFNECKDKKVFEL
jgi:rfaE bifunctional protein kinase chain/domain